MTQVANPQDRLPITAASPLPRRHSPHASRGPGISSGAPGRETVVVRTFQGAPIPEADDWEWMDLARGLGAT